MMAPPINIVVVVVVVAEENNWARAFDTAAYERTAHTRAMVNTAAVHRPAMSLTVAECRPMVCVRVVVAGDYAAGITGVVALAVDLQPFQAVGIGVLTKTATWTRSVGSETRSVECRRVQPVAGT